MQRVWSNNFLPWAEMPGVMGDGQSWIVDTLNIPLHIPLQTFSILATNNVPSPSYMFLIPQGVLLFRGHGISLQYPSSVLHLLVCNSFLCRILLFLYPIPPHSSHPNPWSVLTVFPVIVLWGHLLHQNPGLWPSRFIPVVPYPTNL